MSPILGQMKPWRPYWNRLNRIMDALVVEAGPPPFRFPDESGDWIKMLPYYQLSLCDTDFRVWIEHDLGRAEVVPRQLFEGAEMRWQMILRVDCAIAFCRGTCWQRKDYDWNQPEEVVYRWLLIDLWHRDALYWAGKQYGRWATRRIKAKNPIRGDLLRLFQNTQPAAN